jgi:hypothetical protein
MTLALTPPPSADTEPGGARPARVRAVAGVREAIEDAFAAVAADARY